MPFLSLMSRFFSLSALLLIIGCMARLPEIPDPPVGTYRVNTETFYHVFRRTFLLHIPPKYRPEEPLPLVIVIHGAFSNGKQTETETGFSALADKERFLVAYPEGVGLFGFFQHWNAGHCCGKAADDQVDDVGFIAEVISAVRGKFSVDPSRVYLAGMSNGGMLTYRFAAERGEDLAAVAVVSGAIGSSVDGEKPRCFLPEPPHEVSLIVFHGSEDDTIPAYDTSHSRKSGKRLFLPAAYAAEFWSTAIGCEQEPVKDGYENGAIERLVWNGCRGGGSVEFHLLSGWGHQWPAPWFTDRLKPDHPLKGFDATKRIWDFFSRFRRDVF
jgi:polyhydroxybutyrate depolymerase